MADSDPDRDTGRGHVYVYTMEWSVDIDAHTESISALATPQGGSNPCELLSRVLYEQLCSTFDYPDNYLH